MKKYANSYKNAQIVGVKYDFRRSEIRFARKNIEHFLYFMVLALAFEHGNLSVVVKRSISNIMKGLQSSFHVMGSTGFILP